MDWKFGECIFVEKKNDTFLESEDLESFIREFGEETKSSFVGYFPPYTNILHEELKSTTEEYHWTVVYHAKDDSMRLLTFDSTFAIRRKIDETIEKARSKDYINIYKTKDIVYL